MERSENRELESREELVVGPEGMLLGRVFGIEEGSPIPREFEEARRKVIDEVLDTSLTTRERNALIYRFGLDGKGPRTIEQTANELGILMRGLPYAGERARQLEAKALRKLRHPMRTVYFEGLLMSLPEDRLGRVVWGINYGIELTRQIDVTKLTSLRLPDLGLSPGAVQELIDKLVILPGTKAENGKLVRLPGEPENVRLLGVLPRLCPILSDTTRVELIQGLAQVDSDN